MKLNKIFLKNFGVRESLMSFISCGRRTKEEILYASQFIDRVLKVVNTHKRKGCKESEFIPKFDLGETDLLSYTLRVLCNRGVLKKEIRYFLRK